MVHWFVVLKSNQIILQKEIHALTNFCYKQIYLNYKLHGITEKKNEIKIKVLVSNIQLSVCCKSVSCYAKWQL